MSLDHLPPNIEQGIHNFASERHISHDEAVIQLLDKGLTLLEPKPEKNALSDGKFTIPGLSGEPMSDEDAAMMDEIVAEAMEARRARWERIMRD